MTGLTRDHVRVICLCLATLVGACFLASASAFANQLFMNIEGFAGESRDAADPGWVPLTKIQWSGSTNQTGSSDAASSSAAGRDHSLTVTKTMDKASPALFAAMTSGKHFRSVTIEEVDSAHRRFTKITMQDVIIGSLHRSIGVGNTAPIETLMLNFARVSMVESSGKPQTGASSQSTQQP